MKTTYTNFADVAQALGFRVKRKAVKKEAARECPICGSEMRHISGTNVWVCDAVLLEEKELKGKQVQVFRTCGERMLESKNGK